MRLIDADLLIQTLNQNIGWERMREVQVVIMEQPTTYDVEKVVEQLECAEFETSQEPHAVNLYRAIEIVEGGGKDE
jgi:hypothetical protein